MTTTKKKNEDRGTLGQLMARLCLSHFLAFPATLLDIYTKDLVFPLKVISKVRRGWCNREKGFTPYQMPKQSRKYTHLIESLNTESW